MVGLTPAPTAPRERRVSIALSPPHSAAQRELIQTPHSVALLGGGRWGKTEAEVRRIVRAMSRRPGLYYWVGLSWQSASMAKAWRMLRHTWEGALRAADIDPRVHINRSRHEISLPNGALLMLRTAEAPESIAGDGPLGIVGDEYTYWDEEVWTRFVQPSLADHNAWCHLIGRPNGSNWGYDLWQSSAGWPGWLQRRYTIYDNPLLDRAFVDDLHDRTPAPIWDQEYLAIPDSGGGGGIPRADVLAAMARWRDMAPDDRRAGRPVVVAIDVSEGGAGDRTTMAVRHGWTVDRVVDITPQRQGDMMPIADAAMLSLASSPTSYAIVDAVGVGAMLPAAIRRAGGTARAFKASASTRMRDSTGQFGFANMTTAAWWHLAELLRHDGPGIALPDDPALLSELTAPRFEVRAGHRLAMEHKDAVRRRLGRSPDRADAVVMAFWGARAGDGDASDQPTKLVW